MLLTKKMSLLTCTIQLFLLKESFNGPIAARLQQAGYNALIYDHRGWGSSDPISFTNGAASGFPRHEYNPAQQARDIHDAIKYAKSLNGVNEEKVILWGTGHGGGVSFIAATEDKNVKAVIGAFPWFSGKQNIQLFPHSLLEAAKAEEGTSRTNPKYELKFHKIWDDTLEEAKGDRGQIFAHGEGPFMLLEEARRLAKDAGTPWENRTTLRSFWYLANTEPQDYLWKIKVPILVVCGPNGVFTYNHEGQKKTLAERAPQAEVVLVPGEDIRVSIPLRWIKQTTDIFQDSEPSFEPMMEAHLAFLKKHFGD
jgi:uncharacterized protein